MAKRSFQPKVRGSMPSMRGNRKTAFNPKKRPAPDLSRGVTGITGAAENVMMGGTDTVSITASRTTGVAPLGVFFEAVVGGYTQANPWHEMLYVWDFGEAGTWGYGNPQYNSKQDATGPVAAHVFSETGAAGGPYAVTLNVYERSGGVTTLFGTDTVSITATSAVDEFDVAGKLLLINQGGTVGAHSFSNATERTIAGTYALATLQADITSGFRAILFRHGETHTIAGQMDFNTADGPFLLGAYDAANGAKPKITSSNNAHTLQFITEGAADTRIVGIGLDNTGTTSDCIRFSRNCTDTLILNVDFFEHSTNGIHGSVSSFTANSSAAPDKSFIHGCTFGNGVSSNNTPIRFGSVRCSIQGNDLNGVNGTDIHLIRAHMTHKSVVSHNKFDAVLQGGQGSFNTQSYKISPPVETSAKPVGWTYTTSAVLISDNEFVGGQTEPVHLTPANGAGNEYVADCIFERNYMRSPSPSTSRMVVVSGDRVTVRNNIVRVQAVDDPVNMEICRTKGNGGLLTLAQNIWIYNNSISNTDSPNASGSAIVVVDAGTVVGGAHASNNVGWHDGAGGATDVPLLETVAAGTNSNNTQTTTQPFAVDPPVNVVDFKLVTASAAEDAGGEVVGLFEDYERVAISGVNQGAFQNSP